MQKPLVPAVCGLLYLVVFLVRFLLGSLKQFVAAGRLSVAPDELLSAPAFPWPTSAAGRLSVAPDELLSPPNFPWLTSVCCWEALSCSRRASLSS